MPASKAVPNHPLRMLGGVDFKKLIRLKDGSGAPVNITGWSLAAGWISTTTGVYLDFTVTIVNPSAGEFLIEMSSDKTLQMNNYGNYDVVKTVNGIKSLLFEGPIEYDKVVTRG